MNKKRPFQWDEVKKKQQSRWRKGESSQDHISSVMKCLKDCRAECCGIVPIDRRLLRRNKSKMQRKPLDIIYAGNEAICVTEDGSCVFLNSNRKCAIYNQRPGICRLYGTTEKLPCPYIDVHGNTRTREQVQTVKDKICAFVDTRLANHF